VTHNHISDRLFRQQAAGPHQILRLRCAAFG